MEQVAPGAVLAESIAVAPRATGDVIRRIAGESTAVFEKGMLVAVGAGGIAVGEITAGAGAAGCCSAAAVTDAALGGSTVGGTAVAAGAMGVAAIAMVAVGGRGVAAEAGALAVASAGARVAVPLGETVAVARVAVRASSGSSLPETAPIATSRTMSGAPKPAARCGQPPLDQRHHDLSQVMAALQCLERWGYAQGPRKGSPA
jgi:hypothetical protein